ncbi:MAG TPA: hypothetical protein VFC17_07280 [Candidatus Limnocylindrales bacterium]|nr:hypothetical protein [Candidatus Limnocylindrales bacterium]
MITIHTSTRVHSFLRVTAHVGIFIWLMLKTVSATAQGAGPAISPSIHEPSPGALNNAPAQKKIHPALWEALREDRGLPPQSDALRARSHLIPKPDGRLLVTIKAAVTSEVLTNIQQSGGVLLSAFPQGQTIRAEIPVASLDTIANLTDVTDIQPAYFCDNARSATNVLSAFVPTVSGVKTRPRSMTNETSP